MRLQDRRRCAIGRAFRPDLLITDSPGRLAHRQIGGEGDHAACRPKSRVKIPACKKQMLSILPIDLIKVVEIAAIEDGLKLSGRSRRRFGTSWRSGRPGSRASPGNRADSMIG